MSSDLVKEVKAAMERANGSVEDLEKHTETLRETVSDAKGKLSDIGFKSRFPYIYGQYSDVTPFCVSYAMTVETWTSDAAIPQSPASIRALFRGTSIDCSYDSDSSMFTLELMIVVDLTREKLAKPEGVGLSGETKVVLGLKKRTHRSNVLSVRPQTRSTRLKPLFEKKRDRTERPRFFGFFGPAAVDDQGLSRDEARLVADSYSLNPGLFYLKTEK